MDSSSAQATPKELWKEIIIPTNDSYRQFSKFKENCWISFRSLKETTYEYISRNKLKHQLYTSLTINNKKLRFSDEFLITAYHFSLCPWLAYHTTGIQLSHSFNGMTEWLIWAVFPSLVWILVSVFLFTLKLIHNSEIQRSGL